MKRVIISIFSVAIAVAAVLISLVEFKPEYYTISVFFMVSLSIPTYFILIKKTDRNKAVKAILALSIFSMVIETIGVLTGLPYGQFTYGERLGAKIGVIPWTVSFGWVPLVIAAWALTEMHFKKYSILKKSLAGAVILTIFDLVLDPGSAALNFWEWTPEGIYYTVPVLNYLGWIFSGFIGMLIILAILKDEKPHRYLLLTAFFGNIFWTFIALMEQMLIPLVIGIALTAFLAKIIFAKE